MGNPLTLTDLANAIDTVIGGNMGSDTLRDLWLPAVHKKQSRLAKMLRKSDEGERIDYKDSKGPFLINTHVERGYEEIASQILIIGNTNIYHMRALPPTVYPNVLQEIAQEHDIDCINPARGSQHYPLSALRNVFLFTAGVEPHAEYQHLVEKMYAVTHAQEELNLRIGNYKKKETQKFMETTSPVERISSLED